MRTFTLHLPPLTEDQQIQLEETLLKIPQADTLAQGDENLQVTAEDVTLRDLVAAIYAWGSQHAGMLLRVSVSREGHDPMVLGRHSPNEIMHYLTAEG